MDSRNGIALEEPRRVGTSSMPFRIGRAELARNTALNFVGQLLPLIAGVGFMPYIVKGLGPDSFGVLGIVWVVFGYFTMFDFGLGRATTKLLAEWLPSQNGNRIPEMVWTSLTVQLVLGVAGCSVLVGLTPILVNQVLKIPSYLISETRMTFFILAATLPVVLVTGGLRAVLEGCERFDLSNLLRIPMSTLTFALPALAIPFGLRLPGIMILLAASRFVFALIHFLLCAKVLPSLGSRPVFHRDVVWPLLTFGGWVTVGNLVNPVLIYMDRFLIGSLLSMAMVGFYVAPFEGITKLWMIPASLTTAVFPACSALGSEGRKELEILYTRSIRYLLLILSPVCLSIFLYAKPITQVWLGPEFASQSSVVLQILALGVLVNCFAHIPYCFIQALGRPDAAAKLFVIELVPYAFFAWWMIRHYGIAGAASAWSIRVAIEVGLLMFIVWRVFSLSPRGALDRRMMSGLAALGAMGTAVVATVRLLRDSFFASASVSTFWIGTFALIVWKYVLEEGERASVVAIVSPRRNAIKSRRVA